MKAKTLPVVLALACASSVFAVGRPAAESGMSAPPASAQATEPALLKRTINVTLRRYLRYWKNPSAAEPVYNTWSWVPLISFAVNGPVAGGSQVYVEFDTPDGKPWLRHNMRTPTLEPDFWEQLEIDGLNYDELEKKAITTPAGG